MWQEKKFQTATPPRKKNMLVLSSYLTKRLFKFSLLHAVILLASCITLDSYGKENDSFPATLIGVHHLGADYSIYRFHINKSIGDSVGEGGGGGGMVCCLTLPRKWQPSLVVDVRWAVDHVIRSSKPGSQDTAEVEGIYIAKVPVEQYSEPGDFYVHFFPNGRVRVVVTSFGSDSNEHPIRAEDGKAIRTATVGRRVEKLFSKEEAAQREKAADGARKLYGDWR